MLCDDPDKSEVCQARVFVLIDQDVGLHGKHVRNQSRGLAFKIIPLSSPRGSFPGCVYTLTHRRPLGAIRR